MHVAMQTPFPRCTSDIEGMLEDTWTFRELGSINLKGD